MFFSISNFWKKIWDKWNIRGVILFSLFLQIFLIVFSPLRKRTRSFLGWFVWLAYLLADWAAGYCVGLISSNIEYGKSTTTENEDLMAFWGPFLLLHLGGPDTISAFALEDNELWLRHLLALIFQLVTAIYVFLLTLPHNTLRIPTLLLFLAGTLKYAERIRALYVAAINNFRKSLLPAPEPGPNYAKLMEEYFSRKQAGLPAKIDMISELHQESNKMAHQDKSQEGAQKNINDLLEEVQKAYIFFRKFRGLIVDMIYSSRDRRETLEYFGSRNAEEALRVIEIELGFMYEVFYTKASAARHWFWYPCKFVSFISVVIALVLFTLRDNHTFDKFDHGITYALLYGALALDIMSFLMQISADYTATLSDEYQMDSPGASCFQKFKVRVSKYFNEKILVHFLSMRKPSWAKIEEGPYKDCYQLSTCVLFRRWCGSIWGHNLLKYCMDESIPRVPNLHPCFCIAPVIQLGCFKIMLFGQAAFYEVVKFFGGGDLVDKWKYKAKNPFLKELWKYIFDKVKEKSSEAEDVETIQSICSARGEWVLYKTELTSETQGNLKPFVEPNEVTFDQSLILWHIATNLCYFKDVDIAGDDGNKGKICKLLSNFIATLCCCIQGTKARPQESIQALHRKEISMLLSDYMLYLLIMQPTMMSAVAGIGEIRFQDTCAEAKRFFSKRNLKQHWDRKKMLKEACEILSKVPTARRPIDVKGDRSKSLLFDACMLANELNGLEDEKRWEMIASVWVELLSHAASHCRPTGHVQLLSKGGELISFVWLLMVQLGLGKQFQIMEGNARAKLIVGKLLNPNANHV